jgi:tetratricopeptide (TPR) repeat protein
MGILSWKALAFALAVVTGAFWSDAPDPVEWNRQGAELFEAGRYAEAEPLLDRAIAAWSEVGVKETLGLEAALGNLAAVYRGQGRYGESIALFQRVIKLREARVGATDLSLLMPLNGLALSYSDGGDARRSKQVLKRAVAIADSNRDEQSVAAAQAFEALGSILAAEGKLSLARKWLERALEIYTRVEGSRGLPLTLVRLGRVLTRQGNRIEAESVLREAIVEASLAPNQSGRAEALTGLAGLIGRQHRYPEAYALLEQAKSILEQTRPEDDSEMGRVLVRMGEIRMEQRRPEEAIALYRQGLEKLGAYVRGGNPEVLPVLEVYARLLRSHEDYATAARIDMDRMRIRVIMASRNQTGWIPAAALK